MNKVPFNTREELTSKLGLSSNVDEAWNTVIGDAMTSLATLSEDLPLIKGNIQYSRSDVSVPSPWANLLFFDSLLNDHIGEFGLLSKQAKADWRALISLMALKDIFDIKLDIETVDLINDASGSYEIDFYKTIRNMKPRKQIFPDNGECWDKLYLIKIDGCTVGILSNSFLVCSSYKESFMEESYKYAVEYLKKANFMDGEYNFIDPTSKIKEDFSLLVYMVEYLHAMKKAIIKTDVDGKCGSFIKNVCTLLDSFSEDLKSGLDERYMSKCKEITSPDNRLYTFEDAQSGIDDVLGLFNCVKLKKIDLKTVADMIKLKNSNKIMLDILGVGLEKIRNANRDIIALPNGAEIFTTEDKFLDKITLIDCFEGKSPFEEFGIGRILESQDNQKYCCLIPLKEKFLDMYETEYEAREKIKIDGNFDDGLDIILKFTIDGKDLEEKRHYSKEQYNIVKDSDIPFVAIWPYADIKKVKEDGEKISAWNKFYVFEEHKEYDPSGLMKYEPCCVEIKSRKQAGYLDTSKLKDKKDGMSRVISHTDHLPTYMKIKKKNNMDMMEDLGLIIFKEPEIKNTIYASNKRYVGMDFGTTSTTAFCCENVNGGQEKFIKFGTMKSNVNRSKIDGIVEFDSSNKVDWKQVSIGGDKNGCCVVYCSDVEAQEPALDFMPLCYSAHKFYPSIFKFNASDIVGDIKEHSLLSGNILYDAAIMDEGINRNLKWGRHDNQAMEGYLSQFMSNIAFTLAKEDVGTIIWRFSYPTSLSKSEELNFKTIVKEIVNQINKTTGIISETETQNTFFTESIVAAKFHKSANDYLCIDIGGGSTDVSLWKGSLQESGLPENLMQFSVGIASRKIFTEALANIILNCKDVNDRTREKLQRNIKKIGFIYDDIIESTKNHIAPEGQMVSKDKDSIGVIMETFGREMEPAIHSNGNDIMDWIMSSTISDEAMNDGFFKYIITGFFGLLYYTVLSMKPLKDSLKDVNYLKVNLAGNGSNIYEWLMRYFQAVDNPEKIFSDALSKLVEKELGLNINFEIALNKETLKNEAAIGLLKMDNDTESSYENNIAIINGDEMKVAYSDGSVSVLKYDRDLSNEEALVDYYSENKSRAVADINIPYSEHTKTMRDFVNSLNEYILEYSDIELDLDAEIPLEEMQRILRNTLKRNKDNGTLAPAFVLELEAMLTILAGYHKPAVKNN